MTRLFLLIGEPGIGKTRLAAELAHELEGQATIARGRCLSYGRALSYQPLVEPLRSLGEPATPALDQLTSGGATSPLQLAASVQRALARAAAERPLLLLLEDVHWAEPALLGLLDLVCGRPDEAPILVLCVARPELLDEHPEWADREMLRLGPLSRRDAGSLLGALAEPPDASEREQLLDRAAGNPLFLEELGAFLAQGGAPDELPPRLQVLLQARLDLLPELQRLLLSCAALEGTVFHRGALTALLADDQELESELAALARTGLIRRAPSELAGEEGHRFRHQLIRDTAYAELPKAERARLHERFADWLDRHSGERAELEDIAAYHLEQAALAARELETPQPALDSRAAEALAASATRAAWRSDAYAAVELWRRALALLEEDDPRVPELELQLAIRLRPLGELRAARAVLEHAQRRAADPSLAAQIRIADLYVRLHHDPEGMADAMRDECAEAIPLFEQRGDHRALAYAWFALAEAEWFDLQIGAASRAYERAARHAELAGDLAFQFLALTLLTFNRGITVMSYAATIEEIEQLAAQFRDDPIVEVGIGLAHAFAAYDAGDLAQARPLVHPVLEAMDRRWGYSVLAAGNKALLGVFELLNGQLDEADGLLLEALGELERCEERTYVSMVKAQLAVLRVAQGRCREALELADEAKRLVGPTHRYGLVAAGNAYARAYLGLGELDQAKAAAAETVAAAETTDSPDHHAQAQLVLAEVLAAAGELPRALEAAREAARIWAALDRKLLGARAAGLIAQLEQATSALAGRGRTRASATPVRGASGRRGAGERRRERRLG